MYMMPLMSLWIGFTVPTALSLYWLVGGVVRTVQDVILTNKYRKIYDAEDAERLQRAIEEDRIEAEKERIRAERRAANPDGITTNTSKKKLQKEQQAKDAAAKAPSSPENTPRSTERSLRRRKPSRSCPASPSVPTARAEPTIPSATAAVRRNKPWKKVLLPPEKPLMMPLKLR